MNRRIQNVGVLLMTIAILMTALPLVAFATPTIKDDAPTTGTLTIEKDGSTFDIYQLALANQHTGAGAYTYSATDRFSGFFTGDYALTDSGVGKLVSYTEGSQLLATEAERYIKENNYSPDESGIASGASTALDIGYYLIVEKTTSNSSATVASKAMLVSIPEVSGDTWNFDVKATLKDSAGDIEKKIIASSGKADSSTAAIGDIIRYEIKTTVPDYDDAVDRSTIVYKITDTMSKGLDYVGNLVVKQNNTTLTKDNDYTVNHTSNDDGTETLELVFKFSSIEDKGEITVSFDAKLTKDAVQTVAGGGESAGNPNDVTLTYTNNPREKNDYYTKDDKVITYTTGVAVMKVDANDITHDLAGAEFTLYKGETKVASYTYDENGKPVVTEGDASTDEDGMIYFPGLDAGTYTLTEVKAPEGYSILDKPLAIVITAATGDSGEPNGAFTCTVDGSAVNASTHPTTAGDKIFFNVQVTNEAGWALPGTGGVGTTVFTVAGAVLIALSGILLLVMLRKRSSKTK